MESDIDEQGEKKKRARSRVNFLNIYADLIAPTGSIDWTEKEAEQIG